MLLRRLLRQGSTSRPWAAAAGAGAGAGPGAFRSAAAAASTPLHAPAAPEPVDVVVVGGGVVGLAAARALALAGREVLLLEAGPRLGEGISSRSSEVVHSSLYYRPGSLKAKLCRAGRDALYAYCAARGVAAKRVGKLVVATGGPSSAAAQLAKLRALAAAAAANGVEDLRLLSPAELRDMEPALGPGVAGGALAPSSGIVDAFGLMAALRADAEATGRATVAARARVVAGRVLPHAAAGTAVGAAGGQEGSHHILLTVAQGGREEDEEGEGGGESGGASGGAAALLRLRARAVVNAAGLGAPAVARAIGGLPRGGIPRLHLAKGNYFALAGTGTGGSGSGSSGGASPFSRLIYPLPEAGGLGIHLTLDLAGRARFGPDVEWLQLSPEERAEEAAAEAAADAAADLGLPADPWDPSGAEGAPGAVLGGRWPPRRPRRADYAVDPSRAGRFYAAIRAYWPDLPDGALVPAYAGIRPKLAGPEQLAAAAGAGGGEADFGVAGRAQHGVPGLVHLFGIESPGLTAALALGDLVARRIGE